MKILLILALAALLVGCGDTVPEETIPYKPEPVTETVPEAEEIPAIDLDTPYTGEMFYYSQLSDSENGKPIDTYTAQAVLAFDFSAHPDWYGGDPSINSYRDEIPRYESTSYPRMTKDRVIYPLDEENFKSPMGYTADGMPFVWETAEYRHPSTDKIGT